MVGFLAYSGYQMCRSPLLPLLARDLGASPRLVGIVVAASTITGVCLKLPAGVWSDVLGRGPLLLLGTIVFAVMPFSYLAVTSLTLLIAIRFVHGSATAITSPVMSATIADLAPVDRRATWLSTYSTIQGAGQAMAPIVAGFWIARGRYDIAFLIAGLLGIATPFLIARIPLHDPRSTAVSGLRFIDAAIAVASNRRILIASLAHAAYYLVNGSLTAFLPLYAHERVGMSAAQIGLLFAAQTITTLAIRPLIGIASDRLGRRGAIAAGLIACAVSVGGISSAGSAIGLCAGVLSYAAGVAITTAATSAYITDVAPRQRLGAAHGVFGTIYDIGDAGGPLLGGVLVEATSYTTTFRIMAALAFMTAIGFVVLSRDRAALPSTARTMC